MCDHQFACHNVMSIVVSPLVCFLCNVRSITLPRTKKCIAQNLNLAALTDELLMRFVGELTTLTISGTFITTAAGGP